MAPPSFFMNIHFRFLYLKEDSSASASSVEFQSSLAAMPFILPYCPFVRCTAFLLRPRLPVAWRLHSILAAGVAIALHPGDQTAKPNKEEPAALQYFISRSRFDFFCL